MQKAFLKTTQVLNMLEQEVTGIISMNLILERYVAGCLSTKKAEEE